MACTYMQMILPQCLVSFFNGTVWRKQKMFELLVYFVEEIKISTECVCVLKFLSVSFNCKLASWFELNKSYRKFYFVHNTAPSEFLSVSLMICLHNLMTCYRLCQIYPKLVHITYTFQRYLILVFQYPKLNILYVM